MRNLVGQTPRGADFFPRDAIINKIYRRLMAGDNIFMAAPRRVGKTSIMRALEDDPRPGFHFIYVTTESIHDIESYYHKLLTAILASEAMGRLAKNREGVMTFVRDMAANINIKLPWIELGVNKNEEKSTYQTSFEKVLTQLDTGDEIIVVMVDEFPQTVENIREEHGAPAAETFLRLSREQRQTTNSHIRFILTGSIGLPAVVKKLTSTSVINDLNVVEIPPLTSEEASGMAGVLLETAKVKYERGVIPQLLEKLKWLAPFHIQLIVQELIDIHDNTDQILQPDDVEKAFGQVLNLRNDQYFEHYYTRLKDSFPNGQYMFALAVLQETARRDILTPEEIREIGTAVQPGMDCDPVMDSLQYDGYLYQNPENLTFRFQSALLQQWWNKKKPGQ